MVRFVRFRHCISNHDMYDCKWIRKISLGVKARGRGDVLYKNRKGERRIRIEVSGMCLVISVVFA